mgnify:CR=1 FL=1
MAACNSDSLDPAGLYVGTRTGTSAARAHASAAVAEWRWFTQRQARVVRIALHPGDLDHPATARSLERSLERWLAVRRDIVSRRGAPVFCTIAHDKLGPGRPVQSSYVRTMLARVAKRAGLDIEKDEPRLYPLIYWAITPTQPALTQSPTQRPATYPTLPSETPDTLVPVTDSFDYVKRDVMIPISRPPSVMPPR